MRERRQIIDVRKLVHVQKAQRQGAETELARARAEEERRFHAQADAEASVERAHDDWREHLGSGGFSPEFARGLGERLLLRLDVEAQRRREAEEAAQASAARESQWRLLEARVKGGERTLRGLARKVARKTEERGQAALADRVTSRWSRK